MVRSSVYVSPYARVLLCVNTNGGPGWRGNEGSVMAYGQAAGESRVPEAVVIGLAHTLNQLALRPDSLRFVLAVLFLPAIRD